MRTGGGRVGALTSRNFQGCGSIWWSERWGLGEYLQWDRRADEGPRNGELTVTSLFPRAIRDH